jgi:hypothetical protein
VTSEARPAAADDNAAGPGASCNGLLGSKPLAAVLATETKPLSSAGHSRNAGSSSGPQKPRAPPTSRRAQCGGEGDPRSGMLTGQKTPQATVRQQLTADNNVIDSSDCTLTVERAAASNRMGLVQVEDGTRSREQTDRAMRRRNALVLQAARSPPPRSAICKNVDDHRR